MNALKDISRSKPVLRLMSLVIGIYIRITLSSCRWTIEGEEHFRAVDQDPKGFILAFWHQRLMMSPVLRHKTTRPAFMLISRHRDGEVIAAAVAQYDLQFIRGSSKNPKKDKQKSGRTAMAQMIREIASGSAIGMTLDGPKGPPCIAKPGAARLASHTGCAILPSAYATKWRIHTKSWDRFHLTLPFSKGSVVLGEPIYLPDDLEGDDLETANEKLTEVLNALTKRADDLVGYEN